MVIAGAFIVAVGSKLRPTFSNLSLATFKYTETPEPEGAKVLAIAVSSDRGLCGGIHSSVSKAVKKYVREHPETQIVVLGDKARAQISREARKQMQISFSAVAKAFPTFTEASMIADEILKAGLEFDIVKVFYNKWKSVIAFDTSTVPVFTLSTIEASRKWHNGDHVVDSHDGHNRCPNSIYFLTTILNSAAKLASYEIGDAVLKNFEEFTFANTLFWTISEGYAAEMAAKRTAMENATKNAGTYFVLFDLSALCNVVSKR